MLGATAEPVGVWASSFVQSRVGVCPHGTGKAQCRVERRVWGVPSPAFPQHPQLRRSCAWRADGSAGLKLVGSVLSLMAWSSASLVRSVPWSSCQSAAVTDGRAGAPSPARPWQGAGVGPRRAASMRGRRASRAASACVSAGGIRTGSVGRCLQAWHARGSRWPRSPSAIVGGVASAADALTPTCAGRTHGAQASTTSCRWHVAASTPGRTSSSPTCVATRSRRPADRNSWH